MTGDVNSFRSRFFGGFNREDVVDYIAKLAQERNELEVAKTKAENDLYALTLEIETIRSEVAEARRVMTEDYERKISLFETAADSFAEYEDSFRALCADIGAAATGVFTVMQNAGDITARMPTLLSQAVARFGVLRSRFESGEFEGIEADGAEDKNAEKHENEYEGKYEDIDEGNVDIE